MFGDRRRCVIRNEQNRCNVGNNHLRLHEISLECRRELGMLEHSFNNDVAISAFLNTKSSSDIKCIIAVVYDAALEDLARKAAPQSSQIPFAAQNG